MTGEASPRASPTRAAWPPSAVWEGDDADDQLRKTAASGASLSQSVKDASSISTGTRSSRRLLDRGSLAERLPMLESELAGQGSFKYRDFLRSVKPFRVRPLELACAAAERGSISILKWLEREGVWRPEHSGIVLQAADDNGLLLKLLMHFQLPLARYPQVAHALEQDARAVLSAESRDTNASNRVSNRKDELESLLAGSPEDPYEPTHKASLLANLIMVPSPIAEDILDHITEDMLVFRPPPPTVSAQGTATCFPWVLGSIYLFRLHSSWKARRARYDPVTMTVRLAGSKTPLRTSQQWYGITLEGNARDAALIPREAAEFTYVFPGDGLPEGGWGAFVYRDRAGRLLAVNALAEELEHGSGYAFSFGSPIKFQDEEAAAEYRAFAQEAAMACVQDVDRVEGYCFIGPGERLAGGRDPELIGGFAFLRKGTAKVPNLYFPIVGTGEVEDHVIYIQSGAEPLQPIPRALGFPEALGAISPRRLLTVPEGRDGTIEYDEARREVRLYPEAAALRTSGEYGVTLPEDARREALIPLKAESFAYIYNGPGFPTGGFLYLGHGKKPLAVNHFDLTNHQQHSFIFGQYVPVGLETSDALQACAHEISIDALLEEGARRYVWVGPSEKLAGGFDAGPIGGFVYLFDDASMNRYFPIVGTYRLLERAVVHGEVQCELLTNDAAGDELERRLASRSARGSGLGLASLGLPGFGAEDEDEVAVPVHIARLAVPHPLHKSVLHALAYTPRGEALDTFAAKAICQAAFNHILPALLRGMLVECLSLAGITRATYAVTRDYVVPYQLVACVVVIAIAWLINLSNEVFLLLGYSASGWIHRYFTRYKAFLWVNFVLTFLLMLELLRGAAMDFEFHDRVRPLLAVAGCAKWIKLLYSLRCFETLSIGRRILPVLPALAEVRDFGLIALFFSLANLHAISALSDGSTSFGHLAFSTYSMGFLGSFSVDNDILLLNDEQPNPRPWQAYQYTVFIVFSFLLAVALTNIFIGVISNAFDHQTDRVGQVFVRTRALVALERALGEKGMEKACCLRRCRGYQKGCGDGQHDTLWLWYPSTRFTSNAGGSMRSSLSNVQGALGEKLDGISARLESVEALLHGAGGPGTASKPPGSGRPEEGHADGGPRAGAREAEIVVQEASREPSQGPAPGSVW